MFLMLVRPQHMVCLTSQNYHAGISDQRDVNLSRKENSLQRREALIFWKDPFSVKNSGADRKFIQTWFLPGSHDILKACHEGPHLVDITG
ncbi:hypothetical protein Tco_1446854 [Tanacetum coccineum]